MSGRWQRKLSCIIEFTHLGRYDFPLENENQSMYVISERGHGSEISKCGK